METKSLVLNSKLLKEVPREDLWSEKYRPTEVDQVLYQDHVKSAFKVFIQQKDFPNILLSGPAGCGKTTLLLILYNKTIGLGNLLMIDASMDNGIKIMREKVKTHATVYGKIANMLKATLFDEADNISTPAQQALRRTMEKYSKTCRFSFTANYPEKIIDPIKSRCKGGIFELYKIPDNIIIKRLNEVVELEHMEIPDSNMLQRVVKAANGDFRGCLNILQSIKRGVDIENFTDKQYDKEFLGLCINGKFKQLRDFIDAKISGSPHLKLILKQSCDAVIDSDKLNENLKVEFLKLLGEAEYRAVQSANIYAISYWLSANMYKIRKGSVDGN